MKCTVKRLVMGVLSLSLVFSVTGCGKIKFDLPYSYEALTTSFNYIFNGYADTASPFSSDICVINQNIIPDSCDISDSTASLLVNVSSNEALCAKNVHARIHPASTTKIMTAIVALKYGSFDQILTATNAVNITEPGAKLLGLKPGDSMTLEQAMNILLIYSGNDVANLIAENIAGSVEKFVDMMNEEAKLLGATNTHFTNPHGLTDDNHYTSAYDLYLMFNEAIKHQEITDIIQKSSYSASYTNKKNKATEVNVGTTNMFLRGEYKAPTNVYVAGGKTGTTNEAGHCLIILCKDSYAKQYISVMMGNQTTDSLYRQTTNMLELITSSSSN